MMIGKGENSQKYGNKQGFCRTYIPKNKKNPVFPAFSFFFKCIYF